MKNICILKLIVIVFFSLQSFGQTVAYDASNYRVFGASCVDLELSTPNVIGHQINVSVSYYFSLSDAQNELNPLNRFYNMVSSPQVIFARVDNDLNTEFAISEISLTWWTGGGNPPPPGLCGSILICDLDSNGEEMVDLTKYSCWYGFSFPSNSFCASDPNDVEVKYYTSSDDADNEINEVSSNYVMTSDVIIYHKIKNIVTNESRTSNYGLMFDNCLDDDDDDGVPNIAENANQNFDHFDDDTDKDGFSNYEDDDDDGDGILTINEDYNNNGDPTDDDTDASGVPDYLEFNVTLSTIQNNVSLFKIYPNPSQDEITLEFRYPLTGELKIIDLVGKVVFKENITNKKLHSIDISSLNTNLYFININFEGGSIFRKLIKN